QKAQKTPAANTFQRSGGLVNRLFADDGGAIVHSTCDGGHPEVSPGGHRRISVCRWDMSHGCTYFPAALACGKISLHPGSDGIQATTFRFCNIAILAADVLDTPRFHLQANR